MLSYSFNLNTMSEKLFQSSSMCFFLTTESNKKLLPESSDSYFDEVDKTLPVMRALPPSDCLLFGSKVVFLPVGSYWTSDLHGRRGCFDLWLML